MPKQEIYTFEDAFYSSESVASLQRLLSSAGRGRSVGIKCPSYLSRPECPERLRRFAPQAKLIAALRNPVDRAISAYYHYMIVGLVPVAPIEVGLPKILDGERGSELPGAQEILGYGMYAQHLTRYLKVYPRENILILTDATPFDAGRLGEAFRFLDIDPTFRPRALTKRVNEGVYSLARIRFIRSRNRFVFSSDLLHRRTGLRAWLVNTAVMGTDWALLRTLVGNHKPQVSSELRGRLYERYRGEIGSLEKLIGEDLSAWRA